MHVPGVLKRLPRYWVRTVETIVGSSNPKTQTSKQINQTPALSEIQKMLANLSEIQRIFHKLVPKKLVKATGIRVPPYPNTSTPG